MFHRCLSVFGIYCVFKFFIDLGRWYWSDTNNKLSTPIFRSRFCGGTYFSRMAFNGNELYFWNPFWIICSGCNFQSCSFAHWSWTLAFCGLVDWIIPFGLGIRNYKKDPTWLFMGLSRPSWWIGWWLVFCIKWDCRTFSWYSRMAIWSWRF